MPRLTPKEAMARCLLEIDQARPYKEFDEDKDWDAMMDLAPGLVGAMLHIGKWSLCGAEIGSNISLMSTYVPGDYLRIFVDPTIEKGPDGVTVTALRYHGGSPFVLRTGEIPHLTDAARSNLEKELLYQQGFLTTEESLEE